MFVLSFASCHLLFKTLFTHCVNNLKARDVIKYTRLTRKSPLINQTGLFYLVICFCYNFILLFNYHFDGIK